MKAWWQVKERGYISDLFPLKILHPTLKWFLVLTLLLTTVAILFRKTDDRSQRLENSGWQATLVIDKILCLPEFLLVQDKNWTPIVICWLLFSVNFMLLWLFDWSFLYKVDTDTWINPKQILARGIFCCNFGFVNLLSA